MKEIFAKIKEDANDQFVAAKVCAMAAAYVDANKSFFEGWSLVSVEKHISEKLVNLKTNRSTKFTIHGFIDKLVRSPRGNLYILDHKNTSASFDDPNSDYQRRLATDPQSSMYMLLMLASGVKVDGILWDVIKRPAITAGNLSQEKIVTLKEFGTYEDVAIKADNLDDIAPPIEGEEYKTGKLKGEPKRLEGPKLFYIRCLDNLSRNWDKVAMKVPLLRTEDDCIDLNQDMVSLSKTLNFNKRGDHWPANYRSCYAYNHECEYYDVCHECMSLYSGTYKKTESTMFRLSHSSIGSYFACPRKFKHRYVLQRQSAVTEDSEGLIVGNLWHTAMDMIYRKYMKEEVNEQTKENG